jgi:hypothetical protein
MATSPSADPTPITPPRVPFLDARTGLIDRAWYMFFLSLFRAANSSNDNPNIGPPVQDLSGDFSNLFSQAQLASMMERYDDCCKMLQQRLDTAPSDLTSELQSQIDTVRQELQTLPKPALGTMAALQQDNLPWVVFDTTPQNVPVVSGAVAWDGGTTLGVQATANVLIKVGEAEYLYAKASSAITLGQVCYHTGAVGSSGVTTVAPSPIGMTDPNQIVGIAAESIALNDFGLILISGDIKGFNTTGSSVGEVWADGDALYYNPAFVGSMTKVKPSAPNIKTYMGEVINAGAGGSGSMHVRIVPGSVLGGTDSNVQFTSPIPDKDLIQYDSGLGYWKNVSPASVIAGSGGAPVTKTANFSVANGETWIINNKSGSSCTVTLPTASTNTGRVLYFLNYQAQTLVSASSNVVPLAGGAATTAILEAVAGANATLVSDGTNWIMTQYDSNNALQLE